MKRKIIILVILLLLTTGCTANYNLVIEDEKITETTIISGEENSFYTKSYMYSLYEEEYPIYYDEEFPYYAPTTKIEGQTYYDKSINETSNGYIATYKASYNFDDYNRSRILNDAYSTFSVVYDSSSSTYNILANNLKIFNTNQYLTNITISIDLKNYEVVESNENTKNGTIYTWNFDRNSNGTINLIYKKATKQDNKENNEGNNVKGNTNPLSNYTLYIFCAILLVLILIGYNIFNRIKNKSNQMDD